MTDSPALYACTKCGGANYGCTCNGFRYCTKPLYTEQRAAMIDINDFATPAYPAGDVTLLVAEIVRLRKKVANESVYLDKLNEQMREIERNRAAIAELIQAGRAVVDRWESPSWKDLPHTGEYIAALRAAIAKHDHLAGAGNKIESTTKEQ